MTESDIIVVTPSLNPDSRGLINNSNIDFIKERAVIIGSTWDVITEEALITLLSAKKVVAAFDAALEGKKSITGEIEQSLNKLSAQKKLFLTPHSAYNTVEAETRQLDICVSNIENFFSGTMQNIVN